MNKILIQWYFGNWKVELVDWPQKNDYGKYAM